MLFCFREQAPRLCTGQGGSLLSRDLLPFTAEKAVLCCCAVLGWAVLCCAVVLCWAGLCCAVLLCCVVLCCVVLGCVVLGCVVYNLPEKPTLVLKLFAERLLP